MCSKPFAEWNMLGKSIQEEEVGAMDIGQESYPYKYNVITFLYKNLR